MIRISVVVPAYNEERVLPRLLAGLDEAKRRYRAGAAAVETIVADNGSSDRTVQIAAAHGCIVVPVAPRFDVHGDWHDLTAPTKLAVMAVFHRGGADRWIRRYWYGEQREPQPL